MSIRLFNRVCGSIKTLKHVLNEKGGKMERESEGGKRDLKKINSSWSLNMQFKLHITSV